MDAEYVLSILSVDETMKQRFPFAQRLPQRAIGIHSLRIPLLGLSIGMGITCCLGMRPTLAAESVRLNYGPLSRSVPVSDLREFADTGKASRKLRKYMKVTNQEPARVQETLVNPVEMNPVQLDRLLNSEPGDLLLNEVGEVIHTPSDRSNRRALRSALILDASDDQQITLIDTLENYPTSEVEVEGDRLVKVIRRFNQFKAYGNDVQPIVEDVFGRDARPLLDTLLKGVGSFLK